MNGKQISKSEFKARALEFFRHVESTGESLVVTDHGRPSLEVRAYRDTARNPLDILRGSVVRYLNPEDPVGSDDWDVLK